MNVNDNDNNVDMNADDLNAFEADFFQTGDKTPKDEAPTKEDDEIVNPEEDADPLATEDDDESEDEADEAEDEDEEEEEPAPKPKKKSAQERINELTAKAREAERKANEAIRRAELAEAAVAEKSAKAEKPLRENLPTDAPSPDAMDDDGEPVYPLGEFDPAYIRDLTRFTIEAETKRMKEAAEQEAIQAKIEEDRVALQTQWIDKLDKLEEELPDIREAISELTDTFVNLDEAYGEYLATTLMASDYGPQVMYYLSQNIGEAQKIVASGPAAATLALGRLEAQFMKSPEPKRNKVVSKAPNPPETAVKGRGGKYTVAPDTDDLDAFEREFFKKK